MGEQIDALQAELRTKEDATNVLVEKLTKEKADIDTHSVSIIEGLQKQVKELQAKVASSEKPTALVKVKTEPKDDDSSGHAVQKSTPAQQKRVIDLEAKVAQMEDKLKTASKIEEVFGTNLEEVCVILGGGAGPAKPVATKKGKENTTPPASSKKDSKRARTN